jgi:hypothetical protein
MELLGIQVSFKRFPHAIEVLNGLISNMLLWDLGDD